MFPKKLSEGYLSFINGRFSNERSRYETLASSGQKPEIMVISCVDSRVSPEVIFDASPGELLVVRNVANLVPGYESGSDSQHGTSAALEFGVLALKVRHIIVLGHESCGGIRAFADESKPLSASDFIGNWMSQIAPAAESIEKSEGLDLTAFLRRLELASVELSLKNLMTFPFVAAAVARGDTALHGAYFGIRNGQLLIHNPDTGAFEPPSGMPERVSPFYCSP
nr:carbonic anhydrase [Pseudochelatococcus contaminans]